MVSNFDKVSSFSSLNTSGIKTDKRGVFEKMYKNVVDSMGKSENLDLLEKKMYIRWISVQSEQHTLDKQPVSVRNKYYIKINLWIIPGVYFFRACHEGGSGYMHRDASDLLWKDL